ncbi:acetyl-CoA synthetase-like protein [Colletotrichum zoysiae]|uniref:Acetyl-CoA synthetase-like protein n=1 Tax=Colletotrichum zoysiae TaxID=1216348 RepID=A0AAD9LZG7_9PEZI|nr:acetyl-CoA synthetase-like protein [Colletotrichum zoysiae]
MAASLALQVLAGALRVNPETIDKSANFTSHGGDSMSALRFAMECRSRGVSVPVDTVLLSPSIAHILQQYTVDLCGADETVHELSETQISLVHGSMESPGTNIIYYCEIHRPYHLSRLKKAWEQVAKAEPIFNTTYLSPEGAAPIRPRIHWREFFVNRWSAYQGALSAARSSGLSRWPDGTGGVDLDLRFTVLRYEASFPAESQTAVIWAVHHALIDGWSAGILVRKVHAVASGQVVEPGPSYASLLSLRQQLRLSRKAEGDEFWAQQKDKLATARDKLLLERVTVGAGARAGGKDSHIEIALSAKEHARLLAAAQSCAVTPAAFFYSAWAICLGLYTDTDNVVIGTVMSGRNLGLPGIFEAIGPMFNTIPLQVDLCWEARARDLVKTVFDRMQRLSRYSWTTPDNGFRPRLGNVMAMTSSLQGWVEGSGCIGTPSFWHTTNLPLTAVFKDDASSMTLQYSANRYTRSAMVGLADVFRNSLMSLCRTEGTLGSADLVLESCGEILARVGNWNSPATTASSVTEDLVTLFERAVACHPSAAAIVQGGHEISYAELKVLTGQVAQALADIIDPQEVVAVHADGSVNWIVAIYGVLRAGGVYCPLDKAHPQHYRDSLFAASTARVFLATNAESVSWRPATAETVLSVGHVLESCGAAAQSLLEAPAGYPPRRIPRCHDRAYLCFTSGSTGKPKGVMCTHRGLVAFQSDFEVRLRSSVGTRIAQVMSVAFDGAIHETFSALSYGATLVLREEGEEARFSHLKTVDSAILTPSLASVLDPDDFPSLKAVYLVGEIVPRTVCDTWAAKKVVYNMYGPTEATCGATIKRLRPGEPISIGGPNPSTRVYILDHRGRLAPPERSGEIYLGGVQVAQGYIGLPELSAERFLPDPYREEQGDLMYRTGDRGYWNESGDIVMLGRMDRQIKLQGFRINLEDIEARILHACGEGHGANAVAVTERDNNLVCIIQSTSADISGMRDAICNALPAFAVPRSISIVRELPVTPNMKVDYHAIADGANTTTEVSRMVGGNQEQASGTKTQVAIAAVWRQVLDLSTERMIGPEDNFTHLGGGSLHQLQVAARLTSMFGTKITLGTIVTRPTLGRLAATIDGMLDEMPDQQDNRLGQCEPTPMEREWWRKSQLDHNTSSFNVSWVAQYDGSIVNEPRMIEAWNSVLERYAIFRARYVVDGEHGLRRSNSASSPPRVERRGSVDVYKELNRPFCLSSEPPVRVTVTPDTIVAVWSHIMCDYTTLGIILDEVAAAYQKGTHFCVRLIQPCYQRVFPEANCLDFWAQYLDGVSPARHAYLGNGAERVTYGGRSMMGQVSVPLWHCIQSRLKDSHLSLQQLLVAAVGVAVSAEDDFVDVVLGVPFLGRRTEQDMKAVGLYLEPMPVRVRQSEATNTPLDSYVDAVQGSSQAALAHACPWDQLVAHLSVKCGATLLPNHPLFDCVVSFHDARSQTSKRNSHPSHGPWDKSRWGEGLEPRLAWSDGAKFKIMVECVAYDHDTLLMRIEYDTTCYSARNDAQGQGRIETVRQLILTAMDAIVARGDLSFDDLRHELGALWQSEKHPSKDSQ